jgi:hypothetical protein
VVGDLYSTDRPIALTGPLSAIISVHESKVSDSYAYATLVSTGVDGLDDGGLDKHGTISLRADRGAIWTATIDSGYLLPGQGYRTFRAKSGALNLKTHIDQELAQSLIARKLRNGRALLQLALCADTARFCTESTATP